MNMLASTAAFTSSATALRAADHADPIFAAIERHRRAYEDWSDNLGEDEVEEAVPAELRKSDMVAAVQGAPEAEWLVEGDHPMWIDHIKTVCRTYRECDAAALALVSGDTLTTAGAIALLRYVADVEARDPEAWPTDLIDGDGKRRTWHFFLMEQVAEALGATNH